MANDPKADVQARFDRAAASLDHVVAAARGPLEAEGIVLTDTSNRSGRDWVQAPATWSYEFARIAELELGRCRITATISFALMIEPDATPTYAATWRAEAWRGVGESFHVAEGSCPIGPERLSYGAFDRLVLALLRRAGNAFPDAVTDVAWPVFPKLSERPAPVDHLVEIKAFHATMVEPWTGPPSGSSEAEVGALEARLGWRLPLAYKQYLRFMGSDRTGLFVGSDWFTDSATVDEIAGWLLASNAVAYTPPGDTLEFMAHQGYMAAWFDLPIVSDDPPVHFYSESGKDDRVFDYPRLTDFILAEMRHMSHFVQRRSPDRRDEKRVAKEALLQKIRLAIAGIEPMAAAGSPPAESILRQLRWCQAEVIGKHKEPKPGPLSMGLVATRELDMHGAHPDLALLINEIQALMG